MPRMVEVADLRTCDGGCDDFTTVVKIRTGRGSYDPVFCADCLKKALALLEPLPQPNNTLLAAAKRRLFAAKTQTR